MDIATAAGELMTVLVEGGAEAAKELVKGTVLKGSDALSTLWRDIFIQDPESYPLADRVAHHPTEASSQNELRALVEQSLQRHPELLRSIQSH